MAGNYPPSSDVIRNLGAGIPGEGGAEVRALLLGDPLHTQSKLAVQDTHRDSQSQNQLGCTLPHLLWLCSAVAFISPSTFKAWKVQNYKTAIPFYSIKRPASCPKNKA